MTRIIINTPATVYQDQPHTISLIKVIKRNKARRRRVAKRLAKRCPLFAVAEMQTEFPGYTQDQFIADIQPSKYKSKSKRKPKSPLIRQGRYTLYQAALSRYNNTKNPDDLRTAQGLRDRLYKPFIIIFKHHNSEYSNITLPSTTSIKVINSLASIKFTDAADLESQIEAILKFSHTS
jgi:hypothetical protein